MDHTAHREILYSFNCGCAYMELWIKRLTIVTKLMYLLHCYFKRIYPLPDPPPPPPISGVYILTMKHYTLILTEIFKSHFCAQIEFHPNVTEMVTNRPSFPGTKKFPRTWDF